MRIIAFIGYLLYRIEAFKTRFINYYKLSRLGGHGVNCHIEGGGKYIFSEYVYWR